MADPERDPKGVPGPFYVERGQCITCGAPALEASSLVTLGDDGCYFHRQPETPEEVDDALKALRVSCIAAYRYAGDDEGIRARLGEAGLGSLCDNPPMAAPSTREHVRFVLDGTDDHALRVAERLAEWLESTWMTKASEPPEGDADRAELTYHLSNARKESRRYTLVRTALPSAPSTGSVYRDATPRSAWLLVEEGGRYPLTWLHELLLRHGAENVRWFTGREWDERLPGSATP